MSDSDDRIHLQVTYSGRTLSLALEPSARLSRLVSVLEQEFSVATSTAKLVAKGKKLDLSLSANDDPDETTIEHFLELNRLVATTTTTTRPVKMLLIGPRSDALDALRDAEHVRDKKRLAFRHHASLAKLAKPTSTAVFVSTTTSDHYGFSKLEPFPETTVACFEMRSRMLERLSTDPAVLDIMKRHKFSVGVLTELHPILQPELLGLNTNAGEKVSLRLLTDDLEGTRNYNDVRRVLLHELSHNRFGDHDDDFKALNSQLNRQVAEFESSPYFEPWSPQQPIRGPDAHRLNEVEAERVWDKLKFDLEDEIDLRRERLLRAAEERIKKREKGG